MDSNKSASRENARSSPRFQRIRAFYRRHQYVFSKIGMSLLTLLLSTMLLFFLLRLIPGDPVQQYAVGLQTQ